MQITITVEATPDEVREALGLPNLKDLQKTITHEIAERISKGDMDVGSMMEVLVPKSLEMGKKLVEAALGNLEGVTGRSKKSKKDSE